jgi:CHAD domain-containing protein
MLSGVWPSCLHRPMIGEVSPAKVDVAVRYEQRADAAAAAVLRALLDVVGENLEGALSATDPEYLHQLRVAVRRSRTVQRQFAGVFPAVELAGFRSEFRWLQRATGASRDLDVHLEDFASLRRMLPAEQRDDLGPLRTVLELDRVRSSAHLAEVLRSRRLRELFEDWERLLESLVELELTDRPDARRCVGSLTGERVAKVYKRIVKMGRAIDGDSPAADYHEVRKKGKELRYLLELFAVRLFPEDAVDPLISSLKEMQDVLGRHQDREVQQQTVQARVAAVGALPGGAAACMAMGVLSDRLAEDERSARDAFRETFALFADHDRRAAVAEVFR